MVNPARAYRRVQRDAAILGSDTRALTLLCYDEFLDAIGAALHADRRSAQGLRSAALGRSLSALSAIRAGMQAGHPMAPVLESMFSAADRALRGAMVRFNAVSLETLRGDFSDIRSALAKA